MSDVFYDEKVWITVLHFLWQRYIHPCHKSASKCIDHDVVRRYWNHRWGGSLTEEEIEDILSKIPKRSSKGAKERILKRLKKVSVYQPTAAGEERSSWISDDLINMAKDKGFSILKGRKQRDLSGYRIEYRDQNGIFHISDRPEDVAAGFGFDLTLEEVEKFIREAEPRFQRDCAMSLSSDDYAIISEETR